jgi:membrane fusion protein
VSQLFRREAVRYATRRLEGTVILATPVSVKALGVFLAVIVFAAAAFAAMATYARKVTVTGYLVPDQGMVRATSQSPGTLQSVVVHEGDVVATGDRIAVLGLSAETSAGNVGEIISKGLQSETAAAGIKAESRLAQLQVEREQAVIRLSKAEAELQQVMTQVGLQDRRMQLTRTGATRAAELEQKGLIASKEGDARRLEALAAEQELAGLRRQVATIERDIADIKSRLASIPIEINTARSERQTAEAALQQRVAESEARRQQFITAPIAGRIAALPVTLGQPVATGATIAVIVPTGGRIEAELLAPSRAIGFVQPGREVALSLQAFPYQKFGTVPGVVRTVSSTVLAPAEVGFAGLNIQEPVFRIRVSLSREVMQAYGRDIPLQPGMLVSAEVVFDRRSLLQWLFDPIYAVGGRA